jgi:sulfur-oxidizing protein SoxY
MSVRSILAAFALVSCLPAIAQTTNDWQRVAPLAQAVNSEAVLSKGIDITLPLVAENGAAVPLRVNFDTSQLTESEFIRSIRVFSSGNPNAEVIDFHFEAPFSRIELSTRIRLSESQKVFVLAESNQGRQWLSQRDVRVTVSGCLMTGDDSVDAAVMSSPRIALPRNARSGEAAEVRTLINHPMETGFRETAAGEVIPQQLVESLTIEQNDQPILLVKFHTGTSANPFVSVFLDEIDNLLFRWEDQLGERIEEKP